LLRFSLAFLVVAHFLLPGMSALQFLTELRSRPAELPIIPLSSAGNEDPALLTQP